MARCDIVIPYYQRKPGILAQALGSIVGQTFTDWRVLIVDDGSPCDPAPDVAATPGLDPSRCVIIRKPNGGAASARNAGLDAVSGEAELTAFLDSDDVWTPDHLARAHAAIVGAGADLFWDALTPDAAFGSFRAPSALLPESERAAEPGVEQGFRVGNVPRVMCGQWFRHMHLSCTAVAARLARQVRFRDDLRLCEDFDYYCRCGEAAGFAIASDAPGTVRGAGENLWHGIDFFDLRTAREKLIMMRLLKALRRSARLEDADRAMLDLRIQGAREQFYWIQLKLLKSNTLSGLGLAREWLVRDPAILAFAAGRLTRPGEPFTPTTAPGDDA